MIEDNGEKGEYVRFGEPRRRRRPVLLKGTLRARLRGKTFLIPSFITVVGIFCGFLAIISAIKGRYEYATKCIGLAIILDGLDGRVARSLKATSAFGREFDSLSDQVAFCVGPAVLAYCWAFSGVAEEFGILAAFLFVVCGAARLARFNIRTTPEGKSGFEGLPTPGAAAAIAAVVYCFPAPVESTMWVSVLLVYMSVLAILMVTTVPYLSIKKAKLTSGNPRATVILLAASVALAWKFSNAVLLAGSVGYALSGLIMFIGTRFLGLGKKTEQAQPKAA